MKTTILVLLSALVIPQAAAGQGCESIPVSSPERYFTGRSIVMAIGDSAHFAINNQTVDRETVVAELRAVYSPRPITERVLFLNCNTHFVGDIAELLVTARDLSITVLRVPLKIEL